MVLQSASSGSGVSCVVAGYICCSVLAGARTARSESVNVIMIPGPTFLKVPRIFPKTFSKMSSFLRFS